MNELGFILEVWKVFLMEKNILLDEVNLVEQNFFKTQHQKFPLAPPRPLIQRQETDFPKLNMRKKKKNPAHKNNREKRGGGKEKRKKRGKERRKKPHSKQFGGQRGREEVVSIHVGKEGVALELWVFLVLIKNF